MKSEVVTTIRNDVLVIILVCGFILRVWGLGFGLPYFTHPDEWLYMLHAMKMLASFDPNPHYFENPPMLTYIYAFASLIIFFIYKLAGVVTSAAEFGRLFAINPTIFYQTAMFITALFGIGSCIIVYRISERISRSTGLFSSALLAFAFLHVRDSHYGVNDIPATFFMLTAFYFILKIYQRGAGTDYLIAGIFSGIAIATKYNVGLILFPLIIGHGLKGNLTDRSGIRHLLLSLFACAISFLLVCPWILLDYHNFFTDFFAQAKLANASWFGQSTESSYFQYLKALAWGYGVIPILLAFIGAAKLLNLNRATFVLLVSYPLVYYVLMGFSKLFYVRFAIPLIPFLCIFSALGISFAIEKCRESNRKFISYLLLICCIAQGLVFSIIHNRIIMESDTRIIARNWIINNVSSKSKLVSEPYGPSLKEFSKIKTTVNQYNLLVTKDINQKNMEQYQLEHVDYIITNDFTKRRYYLNPEVFAKNSIFIKYWKELILWYSR